jgi:hypothetical protein
VLPRTLLRPAVGPLSLQGEVLVVVPSSTVPLLQGRYFKLKPKLKAVYHILVTRAETR